MAASRSLEPVVVRPHLLGHHVVLVDAEVLLGRPKTWKRSPGATAELRYAGLDHEVATGPGARRRWRRRDLAVLSGHVADGVEHQVASRTSRPPASTSCRRASWPRLGAGFSRSRASIAADRSIPCTRTPRAASGRATRPVPTASSSAALLSASSASTSRSAPAPLGRTCRRCSRRTSRQRARRSSSSASHDPRTARTGLHPFSGRALTLAREPDPAGARDRRRARADAGTPRQAPAAARRRAAGLPGHRRADAHDQRDPGEVRRAGAGAGHPHRRTGRDHRAA